MQKHNLSQKQVQKQIISQQTIQLMQYVAMTTNTLEQEIIKSVEENPALEYDNDSDFDNGKDNSEDMQDFDNEYNKDSSFDESDASYETDYDDNDDYSGKDLDYQLSVINQSKDDEVREHIAVSEVSFQEQLLLQLNEYDIEKNDLQIAKYLVGCLDGSGYLSNNMDNIVMDLLLMYNIQTTVQQVERVLQNYIQILEPVGVGARTLRECLLIQLNRIENEEDLLAVSHAKMVLQDCFDEFSKKHYDKILKKIKISEDELKKAIEVILKLSPRPIVSSSLLEISSSQITPDFLISIENGKLILSLNNRYIPKIRVNDNFQNQYNYYNRKVSGEKRAEAELFVKANVENAMALINILNLRELVLYNTMYEIMKRQTAYFLSGNDMELKPMILKDVAEVVGLDVSTISRVSNSKYVETPFGTIPLKHLFSESVGDSDTSSKEIKQVLQNIISEEDKKNPLSDDSLCKIMQEKGYEIARRTIAKYREQLNIPVGRLRKNISD